jgi:hypothetical protein
LIDKNLRDYRALIRRRFFGVLHRNSTLR